MSKFRICRGICTLNTRGVPRLDYCKHAGAHVKDSYIGTCPGKGYSKRFNCNCVPATEAEIFEAKIKENL